ncbi:hypothetical protein [Rossellomorea yichunensis]|uniref:hypothetical protein n=1 Tax=Rossellomorea yichunensis TaxID=3077331 RepID=UPI0028DE6D55|nr:hypothetical protein [Rossellomorea sp. YC4-1]MDT9027877.1 hypothetical protein [Rossellomorea sp. YC4-1]
MRKFEQIKKTVENFELTSVTCNKCGNQHIFHGEEHERGWQGDTFQSFELHFGYGSKFDDENWKFDLCEDCLTGLINSFVYKPDGYEG